MTLRPLPRSLDPLPDEFLFGYILRLAHRLDRAPGRVAVLTGLGRELPRRSAPMIPGGHMLYLDAASAAAFAHATRLTAQEVAGLCLSSLHDRYPPLDLDDEPPGYRQANGIPGLASWVFTRSTRYCPQCLAGNGSPIQQAHGGPWKRLWRLPVVFACTIHQRLLLHRCPQCRQPLHYRPHVNPLPRLHDATLHPAQCRTTIRSGTHWRAQSACGTRLDEAALNTASSDQPAALERLLAVQHKIIDLLQPDGPTRTKSLGRSVASAQYFLDLRLLAGLIQASWPEARYLAIPLTRF
jgi:hypothetical protein